VCQQWPVRPGVCVGRAATSVHGGLPDGDSALAQLGADGKGKCSKMFQRRPVQEYLLGSGAVVRKVGRDTDTDAEHPRSEESSFITCEFLCVYLKTFFGDGPV